MEAFAAKNIKGDIVQLYMTKPSSVPFPLTCVTVTVSENGDADELLREALDAYDHIVVKTGYQGDFDTSAGRAHLARKEPK